MFKIVWNKRANNGVILTMSSAGEALAIAPRPVFYEELDLLEMENFQRLDIPQNWRASPLGLRT